MRQDSLEKFTLDKKFNAIRPRETGEHRWTDEKRY